MNRSTRALVWGSARDAGTLDDFRRGGEWTNPSIGGENRRGKPAWNQRLAGLNSDGESPSPYPRVRHVSESQADTLMGVDANIRKIVEAQQGIRDWSNTLFVFMSDNGYGWGDHALFDKTTPYRLTNEVPLMIKYPDSLGVPGGTADHRLVNNIDVTSTIAVLSGRRWPPVGSPRCGRRAGPAYRCSRPNRSVVTPSGTRRTAAGVPRITCTCGGVTASRSSTTTAPTRGSSATSPAPRPIRRCGPRCPSPRTGRVTRCRPSTSPR